MSDMNAFPIFRHAEGRGRTYSLPYWLPAGQNGRIKVEITWRKKGEMLPIVSLRNALFMGLPQAVLCLDRPLGIHHLKEEGYGVWMTSMPQEIEQHSRQLRDFEGKVLVGGLGLGLAVAYLEANPKVTSICVIEKNRKVAELIWPYLPKTKAVLHIVDLRHYLKGTFARYDYALYDIWCGTGERVFADQVVPLRRLSQGIVPQNRIQCWNESEMLGQIRMRCLNAVLWLTSPPAGGGTFHLLACPLKDFARYHRYLGFIWYFYAWLRRDRPTPSQAREKIDEFMAALQDPVRFERDWGYPLEAR